MAIRLNDNLNIEAPKPADERYGPYANTAAALSAVLTYRRYQGLVVGIQVDGSIVDYWFRDGIDDLDLIIKQTVPAPTGPTGASGDTGPTGPTGEKGNDGTSVAILGSVTDRKSVV
jgi:hypothetical protein